LLASMNVEDNRQLHGIVSSKPMLAGYQHGISEESGVSSMTR
jgi:hypothetical protein